MSQERAGDDERPPGEEPAQEPVGEALEPRCPALTRWCLDLTSRWWWNYLSAAVVLLNCVSMAWYDPCRRTNLELKILEWIFFAFFVVEMILKVLTLGLFGHNASYLRNNWHKLDLFILLAELLGLILKLFDIDISWLPDFFRPQRVVSRVPSMQEFVEMLLEILPMFGNILLLCNFIILIFSVVGVQMWAGTLRNRCFLGDDITKYNVSLPPVYSSSGPLPFVCSAPPTAGMRRCSDIPRYEQNGTNCLVSPDESDWDRPMPLLDPGDCFDWHDFYSVCREGEENPNLGATSFDDIGYAWIAVFEVITLVGWSEIMYMVMDGFSFWSFVFFVLVTIIGAFVVMNVCAVVIATQFSDSMEKKKRDAACCPLTVQKVLLFCKRSFCEPLVHGLMLQDQLFGRFSLLTDPLNRKPSKQLILERQTTVMESKGAMLTTRTATGFLTSRSWWRSMSQSRLLALLKEKLWSPLRLRAQRLVAHKMFERAMRITVCLSVLAAALEHDKQPPELTSFLWISKILFTLLFASEMLFKLTAHPRGYFENKIQLLEFCIVISSVCELGTRTNYSSLLQLIRFILYVPYMRIQITLLKKTIGETLTLCAIILLFIFIFSVLGMHFFGCTSKFQDDRQNFDSLLWAMVTVFQLLTLEDWNLVMYKAMAATNPWASLYFVTIIVLGKHLLLNVLVSIMVRDYKLKTAINIRARATQATMALHTSPASVAGTVNWMRSQAHMQESPLANAGSDEAPADNQGQGNNAEAQFLQEEASWFRRVLAWCKQHEDLSFFLFSPNDESRRFCQRVISNVWFDRSILFFVAVTCMSIAAERPNIKPLSVERFLLDWSGYLFSCVFLVEMIFKMVSRGVLLGRGSYCRSAWNIMDGVLVVLFVAHTGAEIASSEENDLEEILKPLRLLRTLCPLRLLQHVPWLKQAVDSMISSMKPILSVFVISLAFFAFYGLLGEQLFKGKFYNCLDDKLEDIRGVGNKTECLATNHRWERRSFNFDNLPQALMTLFVMYSRDGWVNIMHDGIDAVAEDLEPITNYGQWRLLYFLSFMMVSFLLLDMFISILVEKHAEVQKRQTPLTTQQRTTRPRAPERVGVPYYAHYSPLRRSIHTLCSNPKLDCCMMVIIALSVMVMGLEHYRMPKYVEMIIEVTFYVATALLVLEVTLKMVAFGPRRYLQNRWNILDTVVMLVSVVSILVSKLDMVHSFPINPSILRVCRVLRLAQVLKASKIRVLVKTIVKTLLHVRNLCLLFTFFFYIYAVLGVELFGDLECSEQFPCQGLHRHSNFKNFGIALLTLYKVTTGDNWNGILKDALRKCHPEGEDCAGYLFWAAPLVFITFVIMVQFLLVNLVVSSIIQALGDSEQRKATDPEPTTVEPSESPDVAMVDVSESEAPDVATVEMPESESHDVAADEQSADYAIEGCIIS